MYYKVKVILFSSGCPPNFDFSTCWPGTSADTTLEVMCPFRFCTTVPYCAEISKRAVARRYCNPNGVWSHPDYNACLALTSHHKRCFEGYCHTCPDPFRDAVIAISMTLSIISVILLTAALILFSLFKSLQCRRLTIHKNLALAFILRFTFLAIWSVAQISNLFKDCSEFYTRPKYGAYEVLCKLILWFIIYSQVASVLWMFIEGAYLYSRFTIFAMRHVEPPYFVYPLCGWGFPALVVLSWTILQEKQVDEHGKPLYCWLPYASGPHLWILSGTMGLALILNLLFLLGIVVILAQKLRAENSAESKMIWKTIKATLLLVPLLGISNIPLFYEPEGVGNAYMLVSAVLQHSQGIFIAVLYCFLSGEVRNAVKRRMNKMPFRFLRKRSHSLDRTYITDAKKNYCRSDGAIALEDAKILNAEDEDCT
uniref:G_PROTEIN_RECEP_F2_4 domain-containing protein n=1 Tax=Syphacia muris TaxID=451379 RepID=A0A0N5AEZ1_9BILA